MTMVMALPPTPTSTYVDHSGQPKKIGAGGGRDGGEMGGEVGAGGGGGSGGLGGNGCGAEAAQEDGHAAREIMAAKD